MTTVKTIIENAYTKVNGEYEALVESSDDFKTYLNVLNQVMQVYANTPYAKWQSLFDTNFVLPDPIAPGVFDYAVPTPGEIEVGNTPFDHVFIMDAGVPYETYKLTDQALFQSARTGKICAFLAGRLYFKEISEELIGMTVKLPVYKTPPIYTTGNQEVNVDSVAWLTTAMAAFICDSSPVPFIARNADKYQKQADLLMKTMRSNNRKRQHLVIKSVAGSNSPEKLSAAINMGVGIGGINSIDGGGF